MEGAEDATHAALKAGEAKDAEAHLNDIMQSRFMSMFDDEEDEKTTKKKQKKALKGGKAIEAAAAAVKEEAAATAAAAAAAEEERSKRATAKKSKKRRRDGGGDEGGSIHTIMATTKKQASAAAAKAKVPKAAVSHAVPTVVFGGDRPMLAASRQQVGLSLPGVALVTWTTPAVINWCLFPYALQGLSLPGGVRLVTMDHAHQLVSYLQSNVVKTASPTRRRRRRATPWASAARRSSSCQTRWASSTRWPATEAPCTPTPVRRVGLAGTFSLHGYFAVITI
jgi:hypothetical protein